jgi:hypothetical protein
MRDENEINLKRAYWSGAYYALDPLERQASREAQKAWLTAEVWITAIDWVLGHTTASATTLEPVDADSEYWDT